MKIHITKYGTVLETVEIKAIITDMNILPDARYSIQTVKISGSSENDVKELPVLDNIENLANENILYIYKDITKLVKPLKVGTMML